MGARCRTRSDRTSRWWAPAPAQFKRFERDLERTGWRPPEGRFAVWYARAVIDAGDYAQSAQSPRTTT